MTTTEATDTAAPDASATDTDEQPTPSTGTPGEAENGAEGENEGAEQDSEPKGRAAKERARAQAAEAKVAEAEAAVAGHLETIERLQRLHVEQAIAAAGLKPAAVFAVAELADLLDDTGMPDADKVTAAVATAREQLGIERRAIIQRQFGMRSGTGAGGEQPKPDAVVNAFRPRSE